MIAARMVHSIAANKLTCFTKLHAACLACRLDGKNVRRVGIPTDVYGCQLYSL